MSVVNIVGSAPTINIVTNGTQASAIPISIGDLVDGELGEAGSERWYKISLVAGDLAYFALQINSLPYNKKLSLYDSTGNWLAGVSNNSFRPWGIEYEVETTGDYYLVVGSVDNEAGGSFTFKSTYLPYLDDQGNSFELAGQVLVGDTFFGSIDAPHDVDFFKVELQAGSTYSIDLAFSDDGSSPGDLSLILFDLDASQVSYELISGTTTETSLLFTPIDSGNYVFAVAQIFNVILDNYEITVNKLDVLDEFDNTISTSGFLPDNSEVYGSIQTISDEDWVKVEPTVGETYLFELLGAEENGGTLGAGLSLSVRTSNGYVLSPQSSRYWPGSAIETSLRYKPFSDDVFYLAVEGGGSLGSYTLRSTAYDDDFPENFVEQEIIEVGTQITGDIEVPGDRDQFSLYPLAAGYEYQFELLTINSGVGTLDAEGYVRIALYENTGNYEETLLNPISVSNSGNEYGDPLITFYQEEPKSLFVVIEDTSKNYTGTYTLVFSSDDHADNESTDSILLNSEKLFGEIEKAGDEDWIKVEFEQGRIYEINLSGTKKNYDQPTNSNAKLGEYGEGRLSIREPDGTIIEINSAHYDNAQSWYGYELFTNAYVANQAGEYYLIVDGVNDAVGHYHLSYHEISLESVDDHADYYPDATYLSIGSVVDGVIEEGGDADFFKIQLEEGENYIFELNGDGADLETFKEFGLSLVDSDEITIQRFYDPFFENINPRIEYQAISSGSYL